LNKEFARLSLSWKLDPQVSLDFPKGPSTSRAFVRDTFDCLGGKTRSALRVSPPHDASRSYLSCSTWTCIRLGRMSSHRLMNSIKTKGAQNHLSERRSFAVLAEKLFGSTKNGNLTAQALHRSGHHNSLKFISNKRLAILTKKHTDNSRRSVKSVPQRCPGGKHFSLCVQVFRISVAASVIALRRSTVASPSLSILFRLSCQCI
jgi:hypothetical protein